MSDSLVQSGMVNYPGVLIGRKSDGGRPRGRQSLWSSFEVEGGCQARDFLAGSLVMEALYVLRLSIHVHN